MSTRALPVHRGPLSSGGRRAFRREVAMDGSGVLREVSDRSPASLTASTGVPPAPAGAERMPGPREKIGFVAMVFGMFMAILDIQIVSSSLSEIQAGLAASADEIAW